MLTFYLGSIVVSSAVLLLTSQAFLDKIKGEGYTINKPKKKSISERIVEFLPAAVLLCTPVVNLLATAGLIFASEPIYDKMKENLLKEGKISKPEKEVKVEEVKNDNTEKEEVKEDKQKAYDEMNLTEKVAYLESEKRRMLSQDSVSGLENRSKTMKL